VVGVRLEGAPGLLERDPAFVHKFLAGVRAAVIAECTRAKGIRFHAQDGERVEYRAYAAKEAGWAMLVVPTADHATPPNPAATSNDAVRRTIAKIDAMSLNEIAGARHAAFVSQSDAGTAHAAWRLSNISLGLSIRETKSPNPIPLRSIVEILSSREAKNCQKVDGSQLRGKEGRVALQTFVCRQPPNSYGYGLIAYADGRQLHLIALKSSRADEENGSNLKSVAAAFEKIIAGDW
jgi:hypothetical protein